MSEYKLIRDGLVDLLTDKGKVITKVTDLNQMEYWLGEKIVEEANEVAEVLKHETSAFLSKGQMEALVEEIADVMEVIEGIKYHMSVTDKEIEEARQRKLRMYGGFRGSNLLRR